MRPPSPPCLVLARLFQVRSLEPFDPAPPAGRGRRGKGTGNPGKPGVKLRLEDLQSQFGLSLKEAAGRLGICPTTLKRACRRHGIQRWPRKQLVRVNRALDDMQQSHDLLGGPDRFGTGMDAGGGGSGGAAGALPLDNRWSTLAEFIPAFQQTFQHGSPPVRRRTLRDACSSSSSRGAGGGGGGGGRGV